MEVREKYTQNIFLVLLAKLIFEIRELHTKNLKHAKNSDQN